jgi:hypothetical protein
MGKTAEFEQNLLALIVGNIKPSKAAVFVGPEFRMSASHGDDTDLNLDLVQKVIKTQAPVSEKTENRLAVPYKNTEGDLLGIMYVEIGAPRRLANRDLAVLQALGRKMVERHQQAPESVVEEVIPENMKHVTQCARSATSIIADVLNPERLMVLVRLEGLTRIVTSRGFADAKDLSAVPFSFDMVNAVWKKGETCYIEDAMNDPDYCGYRGVVEHSIRSVYICPLNNLDGEDRGLIYLDSCKDTSKFGAAEISILKRLALALEKDLGSPAQD